MLQKKIRELRGVVEHLSGERDALQERVDRMAAEAGAGAAAERLRESQELKSRIAERTEAAERADRERDGLRMRREEDRREMEALRERVRRMESDLAERTRESEERLRAGEKLEARNRELLDAIGRAGRERDELRVRVEQEKRERDVLREQVGLLARRMTTRNAQAKEKGYAAEEFDVMIRELTAVVDEGTREREVLREKVKRLGALLKAKIDESKDRRRAGEYLEKKVTELQELVDLGRRERRLLLEEIEECRSSAKRASSGRPDPVPSRGEPAAPAAEAPVEVPGHEILERLGEGSLGTVFKARKVPGGGIVAVPHGHGERPV